MFAENGWLAVYTFHHAHWLLLSALALVLGLRWRRAFGLLLLCELVAFVPAVMAEDTTRVFALLSWFVPVYLLVRVWERPDSVPSAWQRGLTGALAVSMALMALLPALYVWRGEVHDTGEAQLRARQLVGN